MAYRLSVGAHIDTFGARPEVSEQTWPSGRFRLFHLNL